MLLVHIFVITKAPLSLSHFLVSFRSCLRKTCNYIAVEDSAAMPVVMENLFGQWVNDDDDLVNINNNMRIELLEAALFPHERQLAPQHPRVAPLLRWGSKCLSPHHHLDH